MLSQRLVRVSALRNIAATRRLPMTQLRGFLPPSFSNKKIYDEKYPDGPKLSETEDPDMVSQGSSWNMRNNESS